MLNILYGEVLRALTPYSVLCSDRKELWLAIIEALHYKAVLMRYWSTSAKYGTPSRKNTALSIGNLAYEWTDSKSRPDTVGY